MTQTDLIESAHAVLDACRGRGWKLATAESCTGGLVSATLTDVPGSSEVVERGFVTYSNEAKTALLGVDPALIAGSGAVSEAVAVAMAEGALAAAPVDLAVSITGVAGPGGGTPEKPVGLVWLAIARRGERAAPERNLFPGDRRAIRFASTARALALLLEATRN